MAGEPGAVGPGDVLSACPRLPPENPRLMLTTSDKKQSLLDRFCAAQRLFLTVNDKVGVAAVGNKGF